MPETFNAQDYEATVRHRMALVRIDGQHIVIHGPNDYEYDLPLHLCDTPEKILQQTFELMEKTWVDKEILRAFILTARRQIGL